MAPKGNKKRGARDGFAERVKRLVLSILKDHGIDNDNNPRDESKKTRTAPPSHVERLSEKAERDRLHQKSIQAGTGPSKFAYFATSRMDRLKSMAGRAATRIGMALRFGLNNASQGGEIADEIQGAVRGDTTSKLGIVHRIAQVLPGPAKLITKPLIKAYEVTRAAQRDAEASYRAQIDTMRSQEDAGLSDTPLIARHERDRIRRQVESERTASKSAKITMKSWLPDRIKNFFGIHDVDAEEEGKIRERSQANDSLFKRTRAIADQTLNVNDKLLDTYAAQHGMRTEDLSDFQRNQVLNHAIKQYLDGIRNSSAADAYVQSQSVVNETKAPSDLVEFREKFVSAQVARQENRDAEAQRRVAKFKASESSSEKLEWDRAMREGQARLRASQQRHRVRWED